MKLQVFSLFLAGSLLVGCGSRTVPMARTVAPPVAAQAFRAQANTALFPYQKGQSLVYNITLNPVNDPMVEEKGEYTLRVEEVNKKPNATEIVFRASSSFGGKYQYPRLQESASGTRLLDATFLGLGAEEVRGLQVDFLHKDFKTGQRWEDENWIAKVKGQENVQVPAGSFKAWKIEVIGTFERAYTAVGDYWIVPGVGIVKSVLTQPGWHVTSELQRKP